MTAEKSGHGRGLAQGARTAAARAALLAWYRRVRRDLPWRRSRDPYAVWISEVMLQQTRVETVIPYYERFLAALPTLGALADAPVDRVLTLWSGLGYYRRARLLHRGARDVEAKHAGALPQDPKALESIAGIGRYTAGAIASIAFGVEAPIVDGNVARVLSRFDALEADPASPSGKRALWARAEELVRGDAPGDLNQALMELGATVCTPKNPSCDACPLSSSCLAHARGIELELPRVARKKAPKRVALRAFVIEDRDAIVLAKRREGALYGGMWEAPMLAETDDPRGIFGVDIARFTLRGSFEQLLTHRRMAIDVFCMQAPKRLKMASFGDYEKLERVAFADVASRALSRLARRALAIALGHRSDFRSL